MNAYISDDTKAITMLCAVLGKNSSLKPLNLKEYNILVRWLVKQNLRPKNLLDQSIVVKASKETGINTNRLENLMSRGVQLGFSIEEWQRNSIWIISRSDKDYPSRYKMHLKDKAPPILFGVGKRELLEYGGLAVIGSRNVDEVGVNFTKRVAKLCAENQIPIISGGARGVDKISMNTILNSGGLTIGVLAENLLKKSIEKSNRKAISEGRLLLISPYHPTARFSVGSAMGRNKLIYSLSDFSLVVSADYKKGGTWAGASEELKRENSIPVFVRYDQNIPKGNTKLLDMGAIKWPAEIKTSNLKNQLIETISIANNSSKENDLSEEEDLIYLMESKDSKKNDNANNCATNIDNETSPLIDKVSQLKKIENISPEESIFKAILPILMHQLSEPLSAEELSVSLNISKSQLYIWLKKAINNGDIKKLYKPVRYVNSNFIK